MRIPVFGASIERGYWDFQGGWVHRLQEDLDRYRWKNSEDYSIYNLGISGDTYRAIKKRIENEIEARYNREEIGIILRITGVNDSQLELTTGENLIPSEEYKENMTKIIEACRDFTDSVYLIGSVPIVEEDVDPIPWKSTHAYREEEIAKYTRKLDEVSNEKDVPLIQLNPDIDEDEWKENCMKDGVHPNKKGHEKVYQITKRKLKEQDLLPSDL
ncbi:MAG: lysophospholipase L1 and related esterases family [Candidatus Nanosalina sp. J07AB43]|jgi:Lysophospholipase L1 and related esterases|nr:MAG: lysophospholipase L1 and related esterases family [Candidatus Nanosalina sp. J07AB43]